MLNCLNFCLLICSKGCNDAPSDLCLYLLGPRICSLCFSWHLKGRQLCSWTCPCFPTTSSSTSATGTYYSRSSLRRIFSFFVLLIFSLLCSQRQLTLPFFLHLAKGQFLLLFWLTILSRNSCLSACRCLAFERSNRLWSGSFLHLLFLLFTLFFTLGF